MPEPFKEFISARFINQLSEQLKAHDPKFAAAEFLSMTLDDEWQGRELKQRIRHITLNLGKTVQGNYGEQLKTLKKIAPGFGGLPALVFPDFVEVYGLDDFERSMEALELFTTFSTGEFAVRPFFVKYFDRMADQHLAWAKSSNHHVRRLASEGIRPRLPWGLGVPVLKKDPSRIFPVLELLLNDESEYVRKSVSNNLNDISKDHPAQVLEFVKAVKMDNKETARLVKHALRGLLKSAHPEALAVFGFGAGITVDLVSFSGDKDKVRIGDKLRFDAELSVTGKGKLRMEYAIHFRLKSGKTGRKIFQAGEYEIKDKQQLRITRNHSFKDLTIRKHIPGGHRLELISNGQVISVFEFELV